MGEPAPVPVSPTSSAAVQGPSLSQTLGQICKHPAPSPQSLSWVLRKCLLTGAPAIVNDFDFTVSEEGKNKAKKES